jgi:hypothetical protein
MKLYQAPMGFMAELFKQKLWIIVWVNILMMVNLAGVFFWQEPLAQVVFYTFMVTATFMMLLYYKFRFERILGLGHVLWLLLVPYLALQYSQLSGAIQYYVLSVIIVNSISLVFDINDVYIYFSEKRQSKH